MAQDGPSRDTAAGLYEGTQSSAGDHTDDCVSRSAGVFDFGMLHDSESVYGGLSCSDDGYDDATCCFVGAGVANMGN